MSKRIFSKEEIETLSQNPNVSKCSEKSITWSKDFKISAVRQYQDGLPAQEIFRQAGFNIDLVGHETPRMCLKCWRKIFKDKGWSGLKVETRGKGGGRPKINWTNDKEKMRYMEAQIAYLKAENDFLAKLRKKSLN